MLNDYSQWLNIRGTFLIGKSVLIGISDTSVIKKMTLNKYFIKQYTVFMLFVH